MKIGILTQPLLNNYIGLLQNFALQKVLTDLGHEALTINVDYSNISNIRKYASTLKRTLLRIFGKNIAIRTFPTNTEYKIIGQNTKQFVEKNIKTTELIKQKVNENLLEKYGLNAYVVGSDQVWRPVFSPQQSTYFLDFLINNNSVKKIAYAASFGVNNWEFTNKQTRYFKKLIKLFDAVSVREDTAVDLCKKYFNIDAYHVLDPTMLVNKEVYTSLVEEQNIKKSSGDLFAYILDKNDEKDIIIKNITKKHHLKYFTVMANKQLIDVDKNNIVDCVFPSVEEWIRGFMDAKLVITDSFHGTVFSILFNKPFISIANMGRGLTRIKSLLNLFNLEDRLIFSSDNFNIESIKPINWDKINNILVQEKNKSILFLNKHL